MQNNGLINFFSLLREAIQHADISEERIAYFTGLLNETNYPKISQKDAIELSAYLSNAAERMEGEILDSGDSDRIYRLVELKEFTNNLLNEAEENALKLVLGNTDDEIHGGNKSSHWLLDKFAGLVDDEA